MNIHLAWHVPCRVGCLPPFDIFTIKWKLVVLEFESQKKKKKNFLPTNLPPVDNHTSFHDRNILRKNYRSTRCQNKYEDNDRSSYEFPTLSLPSLFSRHI